MTNIEIIKKFTDKELADFLGNFFICRSCAYKMKKNCVELANEDFSCTAGIREWLNQEFVEEEKLESKKLKWICDTCAHSYISDPDKDGNTMQLCRLELNQIEKNKAGVCEEKKCQEKK